MGHLFPRFGWLRARIMMGPGRSGDVEAVETWLPNRRRLLLVAFTIYAAFVVYGSLVPLHFNDIGAAAAWQKLVASVDAGLDFRERADWAANVLLFIPLAYLAMAVAKTGRRPWLGQGVFVIIGCIALSIAVEFLQAFFPPRIVSLSDIVAESTGAVLGTALWWIGGRRSMRSLDSLCQHGAATNHYKTLLQIYMALVFLYGVLPLDLSLSATDIYRKWRSGRVLLAPFTYSHVDFATLCYQVVTDMVMWAPVGFLWRRSSNRSALRVIIATVFLAAVLEGVKLFVESRIVDVTHIVLAIPGAAIGVWIADRFAQKPGAGFDKVVRRPERVFLGVLLLLLWLGVLIQIFWYPFDFQWVREYALGRLHAALSRVPFETLFYSDYLRAYTEVLRKLLFFAPVGPLGRLIVTNMSAGRAARNVVRCCVWLLILGFPFLIEAGQLFLPSHTPDLTDWLIACTGGAIGYFAMDMASAREPRQSRAMRGPHLDAIQRSPKRGTRRIRGWTWLIGLVVVCGAAWVLTQWLTVHPKFGNLTPDVGSAISTILIVCSLYWIFGLPVALVWNRWASGAWRILVLPLSLIGYGLGMWAFLRVGMSVGVLGELVGVPIESWSAELEVALRFATLFLVPGLAFTGAITLVDTGLVDNQLRGVVRASWLVVTIVLLPLAYWVVVDHAATDNVVELIAHHASPLAGLCLFAYLLCVAIGGTSLIAPRRRRSRSALSTVVMVTLSFPIGYLLLDWGLEPILIRDGVMFSALQLVLDASRDHYASTLDLLDRFMVAHAMLIAAIGLAQWPFWVMLTRNTSRDLHQDTRDVTTSMV